MRTLLSLLAILGALAAFSFISNPQQFSPLISVLDSAAQTAAVGSAEAYSVIVDNADDAHTRYTGTWLRQKYIGSYYGANYSIKQGAANGQTFTFFTLLPTSGTYAVATRWPTDTVERASSVPVSILHANGIAIQNVNMQTMDGQWVSLGTYEFSSGQEASVMFSAPTGTVGHVNVDAVQFTLISSTGAANDVESETPVVGTAHETPASTGSNPPTLSFSAEPRTVQSGGSTVLRWRTTGATHCTGSGAWSAAISNLNAQETMRNITSTRTYALTCVGPGGSVTKTLSVTVTDHAPAASSEPTIPESVVEPPPPPPTPPEQETGDQQNTKFSLGDRVVVHDGPLSVRVRANGEPFNTQPIHALGTILSGPVREGGYWWWYINYDTGADGWSAENFLSTPSSVGSSTTPSEQTPAEATPASTAFTLQERIIVSEGPLRVRSSANGNQIGLQNVGSLGTIIGGPSLAGQYWWWQVNYDVGADGWSAEDFITTYTVPASIPTPPTPTPITTPSPAPGTAIGTITLNASKTYQTIIGWELHTYVGTSLASDTATPAYRAMIDRVIDKAVNYIGINRVRLHARGGYENPTPYWSQYQDGTIDYTEWRCRRYTIVNDNDDPDSLAMNGFHFDDLDWNIDTVIVPLRQKLAARGEKLYVNLNYVNFYLQSGGCATSNLHRTNAREYAEFIRAVFIHMEQKYGFVPDAVEVILEADNKSAGPWTGAEVGKAIVAVEETLRANGFSPDIIAPSVVSMSNAISQLDGIDSVPGAMNILDEISYHRYENNTHLGTIVARAAQKGKRTSMLEWWHSNNTYLTLHEDLKIGNNSAWQYGEFNGVPGNSSPTNALDVSANLQTVTVPKRVEYLGQYFQYVRAGATRIDATSSNSALDPLAFIHANGTYAIVVKATSAANFTLGGLPAGTYGISYTTASASRAALPDATITGTELLRASIPAAGVITIFSK